MFKNLTQSRQAAEAQKEGKAKSDYLFWSS
jgi:hypothetical protein